jgi:hypothetical protein
MGQITLEFAFPGETIKLDNGTLYVELGEGVSLKTHLPPWILAVNGNAQLLLILNVDGEPPNAEPGPAPVK